MKKFLFVIFFLFPSFAFASQSQLDAFKTHHRFTDNLYFGVGTSILKGKAFEIVYEEQNGQKYKLSELEWDLSNVYMLDLYLGFKTNRYYTFSISYSKPVNKGNGGMIDTDWISSSTNNDPEFLKDTSQWTDRSWSDVEVLDSSYILDFQLRTQLYKGVDVLAGYKEDVFKWEDKGIRYIYSENGFRNSVGTFDGKNMINYLQKINTSYVGVSLNKDFRNFYVESSLKLSFWPYAEDEDHHISRNLFFTEKFGGKEFYNISVILLYKVTKNINLKLKGEYQRLPLIDDGDTTVRNTQTNSVSTSSDTAGLSNEYFKQVVFLELVF